MILIFIVAVIIILIGTLIKLTLDEWLEDLSMNPGRLSLKRARNELHHVINDDPVEISDDDDDESPDLLNAQKGKGKRSCTNISNIANISNNVPRTLYEACSESTHDLSDDSSEEVVLIDEVSTSNTFNKSPSMFNWGKLSLSNIWSQNNTVAKDSTSHETSYTKEPPGETFKRQKDDSIVSSSSNDLASLDTAASSNDLKIEDLLPNLVKQTDIMIAGTKVKFPVTPYPCQIAVMHKVIQGCNNEKNCLLESPTGSGKTLALLCGALAWQGYYKEKMSQELKDGMNTAESSCCGDGEHDDNFFLNSSQYFDKEWCDELLRKAKTQRVPKVYYGTRTHKQIEQVVRELKKTAYRHKRMTILSSREHTCIQNTQRNKNELCNELLDPDKPNICPYYNEQTKNKNKLLFGTLPTPWDIEDLVSLGNNHAACPYFGARALMADAEIIFCPYNYIIDPQIRESMQISLKGDIVILDEAHNIEDICRESASVNLRDDSLAVAADDCKTLMKKRPNLHNVYKTIHTYLADIVKFIQRYVILEVKDDQIISKCWSGSEFLELLNMHNIGRSRFSDFNNASRQAIQDFETIKDIKRRTITEGFIPTISHETKVILERLYFVMDKITSDMFANDYRAYVIETMDTTKKIVPNDVWISKDMYNTNKNRVRTLKLLCMNPAVTFIPLANTARSMILASGTLAPTLSFESELSTQFLYKLDANHIISKNQVYIRCIKEGPKKIPLIATYDNVNSFNFQDELGNLVLQVCDAVPYGVLCFFSSYTTMNKLHDRWKITGTWDELLKLKKIFVEPRENKRLPSIMEEYRRTIQKASGAILFAVFRGKVAEGIDFSDNEARCVLAIGIPYSSPRDVDVRMKKEYNNSNQSKGLLQGREWYTVNAFRALNQAIGRCIRHKDDWGAVLLVDKRFQDGNSIKYLPKWIKSMCKENNNHDLETELQDFVIFQVAREKEIKYLKEKEEKEEKKDQEVKDQNIKD